MVITGVLSDPDSEFGDATAHAWTDSSRRRRKESCTQLKSPRINNEASWTTDIGWKGSVSRISPAHQ